jgi:hypothetical protein
MFKTALAHESEGPGAPFNEKTEGSKSRETVPLKRQCHKIFDHRFFHKSTHPRALIHGLKPFRIWIQNHQEI